jgi:hypothetical protein
VLLRWEIAIGDEADAQALTGLELAAIFRIEVACQCGMPLGFQSKMEEGEMTLCG